MSRQVIVVTGCQGKVGKHVVRELESQKYHVIGIDLVRGVYDTYIAGGGWPETYIQCDLQDSGSVYSTLARFKPSAVIHIAAIPDPTHNPPHVVFSTNITTTFNVVEACVRLSIPRLVNISSETVPGFFFPERVGPSPSGLISGLPLYVPVDEKHPVLPQDPYALSKSFGEQLCDAAVTRSPDIKIISIRPSWCQDSGNIARNLGPLVRDFKAPNAGLLAYVIISDLARAIVAAAQSTLPGHEIFYIAASDTAGGHDLAAWVTAHYGESIPLRTLSTPTSSSLSCQKAASLLGWEPRHTWRDYLGADGELLPQHPL